MDLLAKYTSLFTLATVVIGWIVVNWQNNNREERKEVRTALSAVLAEIVALEDAGADYHSSIARSTDKEKAITKQITRLSHRIKHLGFENINIFALFIKLKQSITLDNFETSRFIAQKSDSEILELISIYSEQLQNDLETEFSLAFRSPVLHRVTYAIRRFRAMCRI